MKYLSHITLLLSFLLIWSIASAQEIFFFQEGTTSTYYDQGIVGVNSIGESAFEHTYPPGYPQWDDKIPCTSNAYKGESALKFNYTSSENGNWNVSIYRNDWQSSDVSELDSLGFFIYTPQAITAGSLPHIAIKTTGSSDETSDFIALTEYTSDIQPSTWTHITMPLSHLKTSDNINLGAVKGIVFKQSESNNESRLFYIDNISAFKNYEYIPAPENVNLTAYDAHTELQWNTQMNDLMYRIEVSYDNGLSYEQLTEQTDTSFLHFVPQNHGEQEVSYRLTSILGTQLSESVTATVTMQQFTDDELLDMVQEYTFRYFWDGAHQPSGMSTERMEGDVVASGASGMGLMTMIVAHERKYQDPAAIKERILSMLDFLATCERFHGAWAHWYNGDTKLARPFSEKDNGGDLVETSFVAQGLIALQGYFTGTDEKSTAIREQAAQLFREIEWTWYQQNNEDVLYWHWSPDYNWEMNMPIKGWNESLITYIMAASSPTYSINPSVYESGWAQNGSMVKERSYYGHTISLSPDYGGPLFWLHYTHLGIDPRNLSDQYANYWDEHVNTVAIHYDYAVRNPKGHKNYGENCWGLTSSDDPDGYSAHKPMYSDNGTIAPTAALSSMPYAPEEVMQALKYFYRERGAELFGKYGFYDAFNDNEDWVKHDYLGIDQGPIVVMIENYRSQLLWNSVMSHTDVQNGLDNLGFNTTTSITNPIDSEDIVAYPNPSQGNFSVQMPQSLEGEQFTCKLMLVNGQTIYTAVQNVELGVINISASVPNGFYLLHIQNKTMNHTVKVSIQ